MAVRITPGPFPFQDGDRIVPSRDIVAFVSGTKIENLGAEEVAQAFVNLPVSSTEPPATNIRQRGTLWFKRGEGRLYVWDVVPTGPTNAHWVAISDRREMLVHYSSSVFEGEFLQLDTNISEFHSQEGRFARHWMTMSARDAGESNWPRGEIVPPYGVARDRAAAGRFRVMVELGYVDALVSGATGPSHLGLVEGHAIPAFGSISDPFTGHTGGQVGVGWAVESNPTNPSQLKMFLTGPMSLTD